LDGAHRRRESTAASEPGARQAAHPPPRATMTYRDRRVAVLLRVIAVARAQEWRTEPIVDAGIEIEAPGRLERLPLQLGASAVYERARLRPKDLQDCLRSQYYWYCDVFEFTKKAPTGDDPQLPKGLPPEMAEKLKKLMAAAGFKRLTSFKDWLDEKQREAAMVAVGKGEKGEKGAKGLAIEVAGKATKGGPGRLDYAHWVWRERSGYGPCGVEYYEAAVYSFEDREVALVIEMPLETEKPGKPKSKWKDLVDHMIPSGKA